MSPHYIWYVGMARAVLVFLPLCSVIWLTGAATFMNNLYWPYDFVGGSMVFLPFLAIVICEFGIRLLRHRRKRHETLSPSKPVDPRRYFESVGAAAGQAHRARAGLPLPGGDEPLQFALHDMPAYLCRTRAPADMSWELFTSIVDRCRTCSAPFCMASASRCW